MHVKLALSTAAAACFSVVSAGSAIVSNNCSFPVYLWSATPTSTSQVHTLNAKGGSYSEQFQALPYGGVALKISRSNDVASLYNGSPLTQDQYTLNGTTVWYSLADTGGDPFLGYPVSLVPSKSGQSIVWPKGQGASQILSTSSANDLTLHLC